MGTAKAISSAVASSKQMTEYNDIHHVFNMMEKQPCWQLGSVPSEAQKEGLQK